MDRVRFTNVVTVDSRIRSRATLLEVNVKDHGSHLHKPRHCLEVEGKEKPAMMVYKSRR